MNYFFTEKEVDAAQAFNNDSKDDAEDDYEMELMLLLNSSEDVAVSYYCMYVCVHACICPHTHLHSIVVVILYVWYVVYILGLQKYNDLHPFLCGYVCMYLCM